MYTTQLAKLSFIVMVLCKAMQDQKSLPWGEDTREPEEVAQAQDRHSPLPTTLYVMVLRGGMRGWSVLGSVLLMDSSVCIISPWARWLGSKLIHY